MKPVGIWIGDFDLGHRTVERDRGDEGFRRILNVRRAGGRRSEEYEEVELNL